MSKKQSRLIIILIIMSLIGAVVGFLIASIAGKSGGGNEIGGTSQDVLLRISVNVISTIIIFILAIYSQLILHETGHLAFGLLSGYKFISFRIGSYTLVKRSGKLQIKRFHIPGTGGQCLMMPPGLPEDDFPYKLYNLGGVLFNFIFSIIALLFLLLFDLPSYVHTFILVFIFIGVIYGLVNGIPLKFSEIGNDGYNLLMLGKDKLSHRIFYLQLKMNGLLSEGVRLKDMPEDWFHVPENIDITNNYHLSMYLTRSSWYIDQLRFSEALHCLEFIDPYEESLIGLYRKERDCELLFIEIIGECRENVVSALYTYEIATYIKNFNKYIFSKKRILYAYTLLVEKDKVKAETIFNDALKMKDRYPITADAESELEIMEYAKNKTGGVD